MSTTAITTSRVSYDPAELALMLNSHLTQLERAINSPAAQSMLGIATLEELDKGSTRVRRSFASKLRLVVIGDFKRGKSTLVNALLGADILPVDTRPETVTINCVESGPELTINGVFSDLGRMPLSLEDLSRARVQEWRERHHSALSHVAITFPGSLADGIVLVDTPGLGDALREHEATVIEQAQQADAIIYVTSAVAPVGQTERDFLQHVVRPAGASRLVFVVNQMDRVASRADAERVLAFARERLDTLFPGCVVFGVSALQQINSALGRAEPVSDYGQWLAGNFCLLREHIEASVVFQRELIGAERAAQRYSELLGTLRRRLEAIETALSMDVAHFDSVRSRLDETRRAAAKQAEEAAGKISETIALMADETALWMQEFLSRFERECIRTLDQELPETVQKHFQFFWADRIREAMAACMDAHRDRLSNLTKQVNSASSDARHQSELVPPTPEPPRMQVDVWTTVDSVNLLAERLGASVLVRAALSALGRRQRERTVLSVQKQAAAESMPSVREQVDAAIRSGFEAMEQKLQGCLQQSVEENLAQLRIGLEQASNIQASGQQARESARETMGDLRRRLVSEQQFLQEFQERLWCQVQAV